MQTVFTNFVDQNLKRNHSTHNQLCNNTEGVYTMSFGLRPASPFELYAEENYRVPRGYPPPPSPPPPFLQPLPH